MRVAGSARTLDAAGKRTRPALPQLGLLVGGLFLFALGIVLTLRSRLGLGPWDVLHEGLSLRSPLSFGQAGIAVGAVLLGLNVLLGERPGFGTGANIVLIGLFVDLILWSGAVPDLAGLPLVARLPVDVCGVALVGVGSALYIKAGLGAGPRDGLMLALSRRTGRKVGTVRTGIELCALGAGWLLGGTAGAGTAIFALGIGLAVELAFRLFRVGPHRAPGTPESTIP
jgi:uncharacterized membrane protein YczE